MHLSVGVGEELAGSAAERRKILSPLRGSFVGNRIHGL
jgi:hypothetical protein